MDYLDKYFDRFNYMAINVLEVLGNSEPTQSQIDITEKVIRLVYRHDKDFINLDSKSRNVIKKIRGILIKDYEFANQEKKTMLILTRRIGEATIIDDDTKVIVLGIKGNQVRLGVNAPKAISVHREEVYKRIKQEQILEKN